MSFAFMLLILRHRADIGATLQPMTDAQPCDGLAEG